jgi:hypothetical protein
MAYSFEINTEALKRNFAVYVVIAQGDGKAQLYVGKTGDNREGCNPLISRCGNHFSYNKVHSQVRNKIDAHGISGYTYVFDHFGPYCEDEDEVARRVKVDQINELERRLNRLIQNAVQSHSWITVVNPFKARAWVSHEERKRRDALVTNEAKGKLAGIVRHVHDVLGI